MTDLVLVWSDEFTGTSLDLTKWESAGTYFNYGEGSGQELSGINNMSQCEVSGGKLKMHAVKGSFPAPGHTPDPATWKTAAIQAKFGSGFKMRYGQRLEVACSVPAVSGIRPAVWIVNRGGYPGYIADDSDGEVDLVEQYFNTAYGGGERNQSAVIWSYSPFKQNNDEEHGAGLASGPHTYALEWDDTIRIYRDGTLTKEYTTWASAHGAGGPPTFPRPLHDGAEYWVMVTFQIGGKYSAHSFTGADNSQYIQPVDPAVSAVTWEIDYIRVYDMVEGGGTPTANNDTATVAQNAGPTAIPVLANDTGSPLSIASVTQPTHGTVAIGGAPAPGADSSVAMPGPMTTGTAASIVLPRPTVEESWHEADGFRWRYDTTNAQLIWFQAKETVGDLTMTPGPKWTRMTPVPIVGGPTAGDMYGTIEPAGTYTAVVHRMTDLAHHAGDGFEWWYRAYDSGCISILSDDPDVLYYEINHDPTWIDELSLGVENYDCPDPPGGTIRVFRSSGDATTGVTYQPDGSYCHNTVPDTFTYTLSGGSTATVSVYVPCSTGPDANDDYATVAQDSGPSLISVLANDTGSPLSIASVTQPANGTVVIVGAGTAVTYEPDPGYSDDLVADTFTYTLTGGSTATVFATVAAPFVPSGPVVGRPIYVGTAELIEQRTGQRFDRFDFELLDQAGNRIGRLTPTTESVPTITASTERTVMRELSGLEFVGTERTDVDIRTDRLRPVCIMANGERFPLGVYLFGEYQRDPWSPHCMDQGHLLDQQIDRSLSLDPGKPTQQAITMLVEEVGIVRYEIEAPPMASSEPISWAAGTTRAKILTDIAALMACHRPFFDNDGVLHFRPVPEPDTIQPDHVYGAGRIIASSTLVSDDSFRAPNRYLVIGTSAQSPIVGTYDVPGEAPHSIANRGYIVAETVDAPGVTDTDSAKRAALAAYLADSRTWMRLSFESTLDPRHDLFDVIRYEGDADTSGLYLETGFRQTLRYDGSHTHDAARLWEKR